MKALSAKDTKYTFGWMIHMARAEPLVVTKHGWLVVAVEEYERQKAVASASGAIE